MSKKNAHHGGAWKVAYADFVTAMMALFMVLWISSQDKKILISTSRYFQNPFHSPTKNSTGVMTMNPSSPSPNKPSDKGTDPVDTAMLQALAREFYKMLNVTDSVKESPVDVQVTSDGLRVTIFDHSKKALFKGPTAEFTKWGKFVMQNLAWLVERQHFQIRVDGHLASTFKPPSPSYTGWDLTSDRANAVRRELQYYAVPGKQFQQVTGFADSRPLPNTPADSPRNDRIDLSLVLVPPTTAISKFR